MSYEGIAQECDVDHFEENECRANQYVYKLQDVCISLQEQNIKRELVKNGPVIGQMVPYTDFLAYSEGTYHRTSNSFKFNGNHIVKIVGYEKNMDGTTDWIIQNSFGEDWGMDGYAKMQGGRGDT